MTNGTGAVWRRGRRVHTTTAVAAAVAAVFVLQPAMFGTAADEQSANALRPKGHFKVERPANLFPNTAETIYQNIRVELAAGYAVARLGELRNYLSWRRYNSAPYRSATHGARYVNNYGNRLADAYGRFENAGPMPQGAVVLKDSFSATADGAIFPGPMFVMKKMQPGFKPESGDWRYSMVMPDGSLFGETNGVNSESVEFCVGCHAMQSARDHLFFVPENYRMKTFGAAQ